MPKGKGRVNIIGLEVTTDKGVTWKVIAETEPGYSKDRYNGYEEPRPITRRFDVQCKTCSSIRNASYKNIVTSKSVVCFVCEQKPQPEIKSPDRPGSKLKKIDEGSFDKCIKKDGTIDKRSNKKKTVEYIGKIFKCKFDTFLVIGELDRALSKNGKNLYRNFLVECQECHTQKEALAASLLAEGVACPKCRTQKRNVKLDITLPLPTLERKCQIISEINDIWEDMKKMQKAGILNDYLKTKFDVEIEIEPEEPIHPIDDIGMDNDVDVDDIDIDWNQEIKKYL